MTATANSHSNERTAGTAGFRAMIGIFVLLIAGAAAYWAYYNYGEFTHTDMFVSELRRQAERPASADEAEELGDRIGINGILAERYKRDMYLSGGASLALAAAAVWLMVGVVRQRKAGLSEFEPADWSRTPRPTATVEIRQKLLQDVLSLILIVFFVAMAALNLLTGIRTASIIAAGFMLSTVGLLTFLLVRARHRSVRSFDSAGIVRGDGRRFSWDEFCGLITQIDFNQTLQRRTIWRIEIACLGGERAWIIPSRIRNIDEVLQFLNTLPGARLKARV